MEQREPGEWVPSGHRGEHMDGGKISQADRWWPMRWWRGHWLLHRSCGRWREDGGPYVCRRHGGHDGEHEWTPAPESLLRRRKPVGGGRRLTQRERDARDYVAYREARYAAAEHATRGQMVNQAGRRRGVEGSAWFSGRGGVSTTYASDELRDWLAEHGPTLTATEYHVQHRQVYEGIY